MKFIECLNEDAKGEVRFLYIGGRAVLIATGTNLLDAKYECYVFNDDLRDTIS